MQVITLVIAVLLVFGFPLISQGQENSTTKAEALQWIKGKIIDPTSYSNGKLVAKTAELDEFMFTYDDCVIQYAFRSKTNENEAYRFQKVNLRDISISELSTDSTSIIFRTAFNQKISKNWWIGDSFPVHTGEESAMLFDSLTIFTSPNLAVRIRKAFDHVIGLCGGGKKEEKF